MPAIRTFALMMFLLVGLWLLSALAHIVLSPYGDMTVYEIVRELVAG